MCGFVADTFFEAATKLHSVCVYVLFACMYVQFDRSKASKSDSISSSFIYNCIYIECMLIRAFL